MNRGQSNIGGIVFDLDGTLIDSRADIAAAINHVLGKLGYTTLPLEVVSGYIGDGARKLVLRAAGLSEDSAEAQSLLKEFLDYYDAHAADKTTWMPGALEALDALRDFPLAICTNKPRSTTLEVLRIFGALDRFRTLVCGGDIPRLKPDPMPLHSIAEQLGCLPASLVIVGDGPQDIECGHAVGAFTIGIRGGIATPERLLAANPDLVLPSLLELPQAIAHQVERGVRHNPSRRFF